MIEYSKLQIGCMLIVLYAAFICYRERYAYKVKKKEPIFELLIYMGIIAVTIYQMYLMQYQRKEITAIVNK